ncbi:MAG: dienelactone hydrolase family protein [Candidatus Bathyarchaeia archaeon]
MSAKSTKVTSGHWDYRLHTGSSNVGVVLVHEIFGFDDYMDSVAARLSKTGTWVAAVDLYHGKYAANLEEGFKLRSALKEQEVLDALGSGLQLLGGKVGGKAKVGSMGFCMGGGLALLGACNLNMAFCVNYYGMIENVEQVNGIRGPIQLILASEDERVTPWAYQQFLPAATKYKKRVDVHLYPNAQHAFHRPNWEGHNAEAAKDAWEKTVSFLSQFK